MHDTARLRTIAILSGRLRWVVWFFLAVLALTTVAVAVAPTAGGLVLIGPTDAEVPLEQAPYSDRATVLGLLAPFVIGWLGVLWCCERLLVLYQHGTVLARANGRRIRQIGSWLLAIAAVRVLQPFVAAFFISGYHVRLSTDSLGFAAVGVGVIIVGHVMYLAAEVAEESELTI